MVTILTGPSGSGKTTRLRALYARLEPGSADGFASERVLRDGRLLGYDLVRLSGAPRATLCTYKTAYGGGDARPLVHNGFVFDPEGFRLGESIVRTALSDPSVRSILLDEIGPIELQGRGFAPLFRRCLADSRRTNRDLYVCVRSGILEDVRSAFGLPGAVRVIAP